MNQEEQGKKMNQIIAKCWADETFKQQLMADSTGTLAAEGIEVPAGVSVKVAENTEQVFHLVIPVRSSELSDEELDCVSAGVGIMAKFSMCDIALPRA